jgi:hypothetical protein
MALWTEPSEDQKARAREVEALKLVAARQVLVYCPLALACLGLSNTGRVNERGREEGEEGGGLDGELERELERHTDRQREFVRNGTSYSGGPRLGGYALTMSWM